MLDLVSFKKKCCLFPLHVQNRDPETEGSFIHVLLCLQLVFYLSFMAVHIFLPNIFAIKAGS